MNGESGTRADELQKFFASIDEFGGWPVGMKYCSLAHTSNREVKFGNEYLRTDWWTTIAKADDYYLWKLSDDAKDEIKRSVYKQLGQELLSRGDEMNIPEGWKLVPIEPTEAMLKEAKRPVTGPSGAVLRSQEEIFAAQYQLALAVAPTPPAQEREPVGDLTVSDINGRKDAHFDYYGTLGDGQYLLYTRPDNDILLKALRNLLFYTERNTCYHEETHRGGAIWEICNSCGAKWADDEGGKPAFVEPKEIKAAAAILDKYFEKALSSYAADEHIFGSLNLIRRIGKHFYDVRQSEIDGLRKAAEEALDVLGKLGCEVTAGKIRAALEGE